jgi:hypothetical protein
VASVVSFDDVLAQTLNVRRAELDRLRRESGFEVFRKDVGELKARSSVVIRRTAALVDAPASDHLLQVSCPVKGKRILGGTDQQKDGQEARP